MKKHTRNQLPSESFNFYYTQFHQRLTPYFIFAAMLLRLHINQMGSQVDILLHTLLKGNILSNGKANLFNEYFFITFSLLIDEPS